MKGNGKKLMDVCDVFFKEDFKNCGGGMWWFHILSFIPTLGKIPILTI